MPFAATVLLIALASDYSIFGVGYIWAEARSRPLIDAIRIAVPRSTRAISAAGIALAMSFAVLAIVPLRPFREFAFAMCVGILLDVFVVRSLLVPALIRLVGPASGWPGRALRPQREAEPAPEPAPLTMGAAEAEPAPIGGRARASRLQRLVGAGRIAAAAWVLVRNRRAGRRRMRRKGGHARRRILRR